MHQSQPNPEAVDPKVATREIIRSIRSAESGLRQQHVWLRMDHQDAVGITVYGVAVAWVVLAAIGWGWGMVPGWAVVFLVALGLSILHELEHDLIHDLYFPDRPVVRHLMFAGIWLAKMSLNPWSRRRMHLYHHRVSGQAEDIEERLIGLGMPWGPRRLLLSVFPMGSLLVLPAIRRDVLAAVRQGGPDPKLGTGLCFGLAGVVDGLFVLLPLVVLPMAWTGHPVAVAVALLWVLPNTLRHFAIVVVSSNSHYTHIPRSSLYEQNQVLDHWVLWPLQLFCFNFGATHILHHYVVKQPFYLRQLVAREVRPVLAEQGVPFNDLDTFVRANRRLHPTGRAEVIG